MDPFQPYFEVSLALLPELWQAYVIHQKMWLLKFGLYAPTKMSQLLFSSTSEGVAIRVLSERLKKFGVNFGIQKKRYYPILFWCFSKFLSYNFFNKSQNTFFFLNFNL